MKVIYSLLTKYFVHNFTKKSWDSFFIFTLFYGIFYICIRLCYSFLCFWTIELFDSSLCARRRLIIFFLFIILPCYFSFYLIICSFQIYSICIIFFIFWSYGFGRNIFFSFFRSFCSSRDIYSFFYIYHAQRLYI